MDREHVSVDEVVPHQRPDQLTASEHHEVLVRPLPELGHGLRGLPAEQRGETQGSGSSSVLEATYFCVRFSTSVNGLSSVRLGQTEKKSLYVRRPNSRASSRPSIDWYWRLDRIGVRQHPAAVLEAAAAVLVGSAWRLHDSVEGQADESNHVHVRVLLMWSRRRLLTLYTNDLRDIDTDAGPEGLGHKP